MPSRTTCPVVFPRCSSSWTRRSQRPRSSLVPADLGQIVGGMLAGIAEARSLSDRYSRALAVAYEQDDLLRAFPVPRAEIAALDVELHFAIEAVSGSVGPSVGVLVGRSTAAVVANVADALARVGVRRATTTLEKLLADPVRTEIEKSTLVAGSVPETARAASFDVDRITALVLNALQAGRVTTTTEMRTADREAIAKVSSNHAQGVTDLRAAGASTRLFLTVRGTHPGLASLPAET